MIYYDQEIIRMEEKRLKSLKLEQNHSFIKHIECL